MKAFAIQSTAWSYSCSAFMVKPGDARVAHAPECAATSAADAAQHARSCRTSGAEIARLPSSKLNHPGLHIPKWNGLQARSGRVAAHAAN